MNPTDDGDELLARLRAADPAASLPPAPPERVARLLEDTMAEDLSTHETREAGTRARGPLTWLVAAAAVVVIAGAVTFAVLRGEDGAPGAPSQDPPVAGEVTVTELQAPGAAAYEARCMLPNAEVLQGKPVAFDGTVTSIEGDVVTLEPTEWYAGEPTDLVTVTAPGAELEKLLSAVSFEDGQRYLVAADDDGDVMVCGFSAPWSAELSAVYAEAFPS